MQTIIDPDEVRRFAQYLDELHNRLGSSLTATENGLRDLNTTWRDEKFAAYAVVFEEAATHLRSLFADCELFARHLRQKAAALDPYFDISF